MFITRECDYAVRVLRALAGETRLSVNEICDREAITAPFAYKILKKLQKAGIVNKDLGSLTLFEVYYAIDPDMYIIECLNPKNECVRNGQDGSVCYMHKELAEIQDELWRLLKRKPLDQVLGLTD